MPLQPFIQRQTINTQSDNFVIINLKKRGAHLRKNFFFFGQCVFFILYYCFDLVKKQEIFQQSLPREFMGIHF